MALAGFLQDRTEGRHPIGHTEHVHVDDPTPVFRRRLEHRASGRDPGVVEDDLHSAEMRERAIREVLDRIGIPHVTDDAEDFATGLREARDLLVEPTLLDVGQHDLHSFFEKSLGGGQPDAARGTRDDRDAALEIVHGDLLGSGMTGRAAGPPDRDPASASARF